MGQDDPAFGSTSLVAGLAALLLLTETLGSPLPDDFEDVQQMKADAKPIWSVVSCYGQQAGSASGLNGMRRQRKMKRRGRRRKTRRRSRRKKKRRLNRRRINS